MTLRVFGRSGRNLVLLSAAEVTVRILSLAYIFALARFLAPATFGTFNTLLAWFGIALAVGNFGIDRLILRDIAIGTTPPAAFSTLFFLRLCTAIVTGGALAVTGYLLGPSYAPFLLVFGMAMIPAGISASYSAAFQARERFGPPGGALMAGAIAMAGLAFVGMALNMSLLFFCYAFLAAEIVRATWLLLAGRHQEWNTGWRFEGSYASSSLWSALPYGILALLGAIYFRVDLIMLDLLVGGEQVGHYASAFRILDAVIIIPALVTAVLFPRFAYLQQFDLIQAGRLYLAATRILFWLGLGIAAVLIPLAPVVLELVYTANYGAAAPALIWLLLGMVFLFCHAPNAAMLFASRNLKLVVGLSFLTAGVNVLLNAVLIPIYGGVGAAAATAACEVLSLLIFTPVVCRRLGISLTDYLTSLRSPSFTKIEIRLLLAIDPPRGEVPKLTHAR
jgi:O-antigen/teichoic acid export membrane protein